MKIARKVLVGILIFVLLIIQIGLFLPHEYRVERSLWIDTSPKIIFPYISDLKKWEDWTVYSKTSDSTFVSTIEGKSKGEGATKVWESKKEGKVSTEIMLSIKDRLITYDQSSTEEGIVSNGKIELIETEGGTLVIWAQEGDFGYNLVGRYLGLLIDNILGKDLQASLLNLKKICESPQSN